MIKNIISIILLSLLFVGTMTLSKAQILDNGQATKEEKKFFDSNFVKGCCDQGDAFVSDFFYDKNGHFYAQITDGIEHKTGKQIISPGIYKEISQSVFARMGLAPKNPTKHGIVFIEIHFINGKFIGKHYNEKINEFQNVEPQDADVLCYWYPGLY